jgi:hypothetical protein
MADGTYNSDTHVAVKKSHRYGFTIGALLLIGIAVAGTAYIYRGAALVVNGKTYVTVPDLTKSVQLVTPDGDTAVVQVAPPAQPAPNGRVPTIVKDGFGTEGRLQRTKIDTDRYDPVDRLSEQLGTAVDGLSKAIVSTNESIKAVAGQVSDVSSQVSKVGDQVTKMDARVTALEQKQATPAPAPQTTTPAVPGKVSQAAPTAQVAQNDGAKVRLDLSQLPSNFQVTGIEKGTAEKTCTKAMGLKEVTSSEWVWKNGRKFFPNHCVPLSDPRPAAM